jgi:hypothetical protein
MNVSAVANGQYAAYQYGICNKTGGFNEVLQEQLQKSQEPSPQPNSEKETGIMQIMQYDPSSGQMVAQKTLHFKTDIELFAYVQQLAIELGIKKNEVIATGFKMQGREFFETIQDLLDDGSISREDIINAVKFPPKIDYHNGHDDKDGCSVELHFNGFETKKPIEYASASELFEILWGKKITIF